ncbi:MAG: methyltransferase family protein [Maricaulaceae bacterium]
MKLRYPPILQALVAGLVAWCLKLLFPKLDVTLPWSELIAVTIGLAGVLITVKAVGVFSANQTTINPIEPEKVSALVTDGLYRYSRNPMYLGLLLVVIGFAIFLQNLSSILGVVLFIFSMTQFQIKPEERVMSDKFGQNYKDYKARVRRWL